MVVSSAMAFILVRCGRDAVATLTLVDIARESESAVVLLSHDRAVPNTVY